MPTPAARGVKTISSKPQKLAGTLSVIEVATKLRRSPAAVAAEASKLRL